MVGEIFTWRESAVNHLIFSFALPFGKTFVIFHQSLLYFLYICSWGFYSAAHVPWGGGDLVEMILSSLIILHNQAKSNYTVVIP